MKHFFHSPPPLDAVGEGTSFKGNSYTRAPRPSGPIGDSQGCSKVPQSNSGSGFLAPRGGSTSSRRPRSISSVSCAAGRRPAGGQLRRQDALPCDADIALNCAGNSAPACQRTEPPMSSGLIRFAVASFIAAGRRGCSLQRFGSRGPGDAPRGPSASGPVTCASGQSRRHASCDDPSARRAGGRKAGRGRPLQRRLDGRNGRSPGAAVRLCRGQGGSGRNLWRNSRLARGRQARDGQGRPRSAGAAARRVCRFRRHRLQISRGLSARRRLRRQNQACPTP